jgi:hypothetical protein
VREFLEVLYLHHRYPAETVTDAITLAVSYGCSDAASVMAVLQQLQEGPPPTRALAQLPAPHLQEVGSQPLDLQQYDRLLQPEGASDDGTRAG